MVDQGEGFLLYHTECPGLFSPTDLLHPDPQLDKLHTGPWRLQLLANIFSRPVVRRAKLLCIHRTYHPSGQIREMASEQLTAPLVITAGAIWPPVCATVVALRFYTRRVQTAQLGSDDWLTIPALVCHRAASGKHG